MIRKFKQLENNISKRQSEIQYIIVHYTANYDSSANAEMHYTYFNSAREKGSSADFVIDDTTIFQMNEYAKFYTWHTYTNREKSIGNYNTVSVEICVNGDLGKAIANTEILIAELCDKLNIRLDKVLRHYDVTKKVCPAFFIDLNIKEIDPRWIEFKDRIAIIAYQGKKELTFDEALKILNDAKIINSPDYWANQDFEWKEELFINMAKFIDKQT